MSFRTKRRIFTGLLGHPVDASVLPVVLNQLYQMYDLNVVYESFDVKRNEFPSVLDEMKLFGFRGFHVAYPGKQTAAYCCDVLDRSAAICDSVDTVRVLRDGRLKGYNTRSTAFAAAVENAGFSLKNSSVTIFGCGESARALCAVCALKGAAAVYVIAAPEGADTRMILRLKQSLSAQTKCRIIISDPTDEKAVCFAVSISQLIVNATPTGMAPDVSGCVLYDPFLMTYRHIVADLVYYPRKTRFLSYAEHFGSTVVEGCDILIRQATESFRIWTGLTVPEEALPSLYRKLYPHLLYTAGSSE